MSDPEQRLTRCGHIRNQEWAPSIFFSFPPATIHDNCIILAATHPTVQTGDPCKDGWFLANFYAFNYMLKGLGSEQVWLTAAVCLSPGNSLMINSLLRAMGILTLLMLSRIRISSLRSMAIFFTGTHMRLEKKS